VPGALGDAVSPRAVKAPVGCGERSEEELAESPRRLDPVGALERTAALGERAEGKTVPRRDRLVVAQRLRPLLALVEQPRPQLLVDLTAQDEPIVLEVMEQLVPDIVAPVPGERQPLDAVGVGVLRRGEPAAVERKLAEQ